MYQHDDAGSNPGVTVKSDITFWQGGVIQNVEAAAMDFYAIYQHANGDVTGNAQTAANGKAPNTVASLDAFQEVIFGALIQF